MRDRADDALVRALERGAALAPPEEALQRFEARVSPAEVRERLEAAGVWARLDERGRLALVRGDVEETRAIELARAWLLPACSRPALVLVGDPGVGKTLAGAWAIARFEEARYATARELCALQRDDTKRAAARWRALVAAPLLVVDELGTEPSARAATLMAWAVIDARQALPRRTMLLGNLDLEAMAERYDARVIDRLGATDAEGVALVRVLRGPSLRTNRGADG